MNARSFFNRAYDHYIQSQHDLAIADYNEAFDLYPDNSEKADCCYNRGIAHQAQGQYDLAISDYNEAFNLYPDNFNKANCLFKRGQAHEDQARDDLAIADYNEAFNLYSDNLMKADCRYNLGLIHNAQGKHDLAIANYNQAFNLYSDNFHKAHCRYNRGMAHHHQGQYDIAIDDYNEACSLYTDNLDKAECILKCGIVRQAQGEHVSAVANFTIAIGLNSQTASKFSIEDLKDFFKNHPAFYDKSLRENLSFCQRQSICSEGEAPNLPEEFEDLEDPITKNLMNDPVTIPISGQTYDRKTIEAVFAQLGSPVEAPCPLSRQPIVQAEFKIIATNIIMKKRIEKYLTLLEKTARDALLAAEGNNAPNPGDEGQPYFASVSASACAASAAALSDSNKLKEERLDHSRLARYKKLEANVKHAKAMAQKSASACELGGRITPLNLR